MTQLNGRRRVGLALTAALAASVALAGCSSSGGGGGKTEITFSYLWSGNEAKALEGVIADYNASQDKVVVKGVSSPDATKQLASMSSTSGSFDISDNFDSNVGSWAAKGVLAPLDDYEIDTDAFVPVTLESAKYDGKLYAVPIAVHSLELMYNKKLLAAAGVKPPTTMDELADAVRKTTKKDASGKVTQLGLGYAGSDATTLLETLGYAFGGTWDKDGKPSPDEPGNVAGLEWYQKNVIDAVGAKALTNFYAGVGQYMSAQDPFYTGKFAMVVDGEWQSAAVANTAPNLDWGVTAIPTATAGKENSTLVTSSILFIPANSKHKDAAADFLKYLVSKEPMETFSLALGNLPARTDLMDSDAYAGLPGIKTWMSGLTSPNAQTRVSAPYSSQYSDDMQVAFEAFSRGQTDAQGTLDGLAKKTASYDGQ
jgi:multiple sugar transport system substrate-binding protein